MPAYKNKSALYFPRFDEHGSDRDEVMFSMGFFASFLVAFTLASSVGAQSSPCPWNSLQVLITLPSLLSTRRTTAFESRWPSDQMAFQIVVPLLGSEYLC